jgi:hypothetical protein
MLSKSRSYRCEGYFSFVEKTSSPESVRRSLIKSIQRNGLTDTNFEIIVSRIDENSLLMPEEKISIPIEKEPALVENKKTSVTRKKTTVKKVKRISKKKK